MSNVRYFKGSSKKNGKRMIFKVFDEPVTSWFEAYVVEASALEQTGLKHYPTLSACEMDNYMSREITETEYQCYVGIQHLLTEMYMHDFTGGFPRKENVQKIMERLPKEIKEWMSEI
jgi:hypothetical protein